MSKLAPRPLDGEIPPPLTGHVSIPERCETCGFDDVELFGYCTPTGWRWFCAGHRIGRWYADARRWPSPKGDDYE
jgi:hypothetical protein